MMFLVFFFFKQKTAYEMRISDWSSDVCSSDLAEQEADDRIGRRPASMAEYGRILCFGETDEIVNGQEIVGIAPAPDQPQLVTHQLAHLGRQRSFITRCRRRLHQMVEIVERFPAWRHRFVRIFVAQTVRSEE